MAALPCRFDTADKLAMIAPGKPDQIATKTRRNGP
jgi:hypothetical protein